MAAAATGAELDALEVETVLIRGGTFTMGTPIKNKRHDEYHEDEAPLEIQLRDFRIGKYPITAKQMCLFLNSADAKSYKPDDLYRFHNYTQSGIDEVLNSTITVENGKCAPRPGAENSPANCVTWKGAVLYCGWLAKETGRHFRLPTEAEWEFAARGTEERLWPWGAMKPSAKHGQRYTAEYWETPAVGSHPANATPDGVCDMLAYMIGEWCCNKMVKTRTVANVMDTTTDLTDLMTFRASRGYFQRELNKKMTLFRWYFMSVEYHQGKSWTCVYDQPIGHTEMNGFRVLEEIHE
ncbi:MAG: SUMF1/EgtB/PvdO family nonheme iron enzyme [Candidatus Hydrogenedentes bacterium]|nr:SUMF1/EgtB/PvdO family nonheme iron enzyme [Candidatus Hydrogenedentota bacterium]